MRNAAGDCGQAVPLNKGIDERNLKSRRNREMLFAIPKTKKLQVNYNLRKAQKETPVTEVLSLYHVSQRLSSSFPKKPQKISALSIDVTHWMKRCQR